MKTPKYHLYLTNEERSEVLKSLIDLKNDLIGQGRYTDVIDEIIIKLSCARKKNIKVICNMILCSKMAFSTSTLGLLRLAKP